jgi:hypothetical protein
VAVTPLVDMLCCQDDLEVRGEKRRREKRRREKRRREEEEGGGRRRVPLRWWLCSVAKMI